MLSKELSSLTGVSIRALRHYHQVGVLDEPPRTASGYRQYDVHDLIRVLRIKRLAALGISLERMPALLDEPGDQSTGLLEQLDQELAERIYQLNRQRQLIAQLQAQGTPPDLPPELSRHLAEFTQALPSPTQAKIDRDQSILLAHFAEPALTSIVQINERLNDPEILPVVRALNERFERLGPDAPEAEIVGYVDDYLAALGTLISELPLLEPPLDTSALAGLFDQYLSDVLNNSQKRMIELFLARFD